MKYEHRASLEKKRLELVEIYGDYFEKPAAIGSDMPLASIYATEIGRKLRVWEIDTREIIVKLFGEGSEELDRYIAVGEEVSGRYNRNDPFYSWGSQQTYMQMMFTLLADLIDGLKRKGEVTKERVFISYSSKDKKFVDEMRRKLETLREVEPVVVPVEARFGERYRELIAKALDDPNTKYFLPVLTDSGKESHWVNQEIGYGVARSIQMVPVVEKHGGHGFITGDTVSILLKKDKNATIREIVEHFKKS